MGFFKSILLIIFLVCISLSGKVYAQDSLAVDETKLEFLDHLDQRNWHVKLPIWVPGFRGSFAYGGLSLLPESENFDAKDRLSGELGVTFYLIGDITYNPGNWLFNVDGLHTTLASNLRFQNIEM